MMHVSGRGRGISELDLGSVFATEEERSALTLVKSLDLSHNQLSEVVALHPLASLQVLNMAHNRIHTIRGLPLSLTRVDVSFNQLTSLQGLYSLPCLEELDVSHNRISSLAQLKEAASLKILKASGNRITTLQGIEHCLQMKVLLVDQNLIASANDVQYLQSLVRLEIVAFEDCPVTAINGFREYVGRLQPHLLTIDGSPNLAATQDPPDVDHAHNRSTMSQHAPASTKSHNNRSMDKTLLSSGANQSTITAMTDDQQNSKALTRQLHNTMVLLEQEQRECSRLRNHARDQESQLAETRRLLREQLEEIATLREEREAQSQLVCSLRAKLERSQRDLKYQRQRHHTEASRLAEECDKERVLHELYASDLRQRIADSSHLNRSLQAEHADRLNDPSESFSKGYHTQHNKRRAEAKPEQRDHVGDDPEPSTADNVAEEAATALAKQLKEWLCAEVRRQTSVSDDEAPQRAAQRVNAALDQRKHRRHSVTVSSPSESDDDKSPKTAARHITKLLKQNEKQRPSSSAAKAMKK